MSIGTILYHPLYGEVRVLKKAYSAVSNSVVWYTIDQNGNERPVDGTETTNSPKETVDPFAGIAKIKGAKGERGDAGPMGLRGVQGFKGDSIIGPKGDRGNVGIDGKDGIGKDGKNGKDGKDGDSAYKIAVDKGFTGTKAQWLKSLIGKDGKDGVDGKDGLDGRDGLNGGGGIHKIDDATDVNIKNPTEGQALVFNATSKKWEPGTVAGGSSAFTDLTDVPTTYVGQSGKAAVVNGTEDGLVFSTISGTDEKVKFDASDTTAGYVADKVVAGTGISVAEGTGATENKLVITNTLDTLAELTEDATHRIVTDTEKSTWNAKQGAMGADDNYVTDAQLVVIGNTSGSNSGDNATNTQYSGLAATIPDNLTDFVSQTAHRVFYSNNLGDVTELALGADGTFLKSNGASSAPTFAVPAGSGDVSKVGTPVNNQIGVWTGDGTLEGDAALTYDAATDTLTSVTFAGALTGIASGNEVPLTFGDGLTRTVNDVDLDTTLNILKISGLTSNGFVKTSGSDGTLSVDTNTYLTALTGAVLTDQTVGQTIGLTGARLTKLWATDITLSNALVGSVTGNAGTVTGATFTTALTVNTGTLTLTANVANTSVLTIGAGAVSISGSNTGDNTNFAAPLGADDNYVTDAEKVVIAATSGANTGDNATNSSAEVPLTFGDGLTRTLNDVDVDAAQPGITSLGTLTGLTVNSATITLSQDTNFVLSGGVNAVSFDTDVLSIDATNNRVGIGTTGPGELLSLGTAGTTAGVLSLAGATSGKAIINVSAVAGTPTLTLPTVTGTLATLAGTETLTNKTIDGVTPTVMGYVDATSSIQTQLNSKASGTLPVKATGAELIAGVDDAKFATALGLYGSVALGWFALGACTYEGADDPTFTFSIASDVTALLSVGQKIKLTQTTVKYFIITAVGAFSAGKTIITVYGGTDYTLANAAITVPYFSPFKAPFGFPLSPLKWTVEVQDTSSRSQASPTATTWYNLGSVTISVPIGTWSTEYFVTALADHTNPAVSEVEVALSTGNNSASDADLVALFQVEMVSQTFRNYTLNRLSARKFLTIAAKTSYYLNTRTVVASLAGISNLNSTNSLIIRAISAYL